jgi:hypothetical protein
MYVFMTPQVQIWMPAILALFGSLLVVVFSAWLNTKAVTAHIDGVDKKLSAQIDGIDKKLTAQIDGIDKKLTSQIEALRAEMRQGFAELRLDFHTEISQLTRRVERLEEQRGLVRP